MMSPGQARTADINEGVYSSKGAGAGAGSNHYVAQIKTARNPGCQSFDTAESAHELGALAFAIVPVRARVGWAILAAASCNCR
jgi:hypothetical protein